MVENETIYVWSRCLVKFIFQCLPFLFAAEFVIYIVLLSVLLSRFIFWHFPPYSGTRVSCFPPFWWPVPTCLSFPYGWINPFPVWAFQHFSCLPHDLFHTIFVTFCVWQSMFLSILCSCPYLCLLLLSYNLCTALFAKCIFFKSAREFAQRVRQQNYK